MTAPVPDLSFLIPSKAKAVVALLGSALSFAVPYVLEVTNSLPAPWPAVIGVVLFILSALGVYRAPYVPTGATMAPDTPAVAQATTQSVISALPTGTAVDGNVNIVAGEYRNPWQ